MTTLNETLTLGLVLVLLFGSICLYLYTRIQQNEQKLNLVENILLDLKIANEIKSYPDLPAGAVAMAAPLSGGDSSPAAYKPMDSSDVEAGHGTDSAVELEAVAEDSIGIGSGIGSSAAIQPLPFEDSSSSSSPASEVEMVSTAAPEAAAVPATKVTPNYTALTMSELKALAKQRGVSGANGMRRQQLIEVLNTSDRSAPAESFLEINA